MAVSDLGATALAISTTFFCLAIATIGLRIWAFHIRARPWKLHDSLIVLSIVFQTCLLVSLFYAAFYGNIGYHTDQVNASSMSHLYKSFVGQSVSWILATTTVKMSILIFYLDIFRFTRSYQLWIHGFIGFVLTYGIASVLCVFTICRPLPRFWDRSLDGRCGNVMSAMFATALINCVEDLAVVILPLPVIWSLQMSRQKKVGLSALIGIGFVIFGINVARLILSSHKNDTDPSHSLAYQSIFLNLEVHLGIMNACLPLVKPVFTRKKTSTPSSNSYMAPSGYSDRSKSVYSPVWPRSQVQHDEQLSQLENSKTQLLSYSDRRSST